jgi:hypothetical protein
MILKISVFLMFIFGTPLAAQIRMNRASDFGQIEDP